MIQAPTESENIYGDRGSYELALRRCERFWVPKVPVEVRPVLEPRTPCARGTSRRYWVRVWVGRRLDSDEWYYIRPCQVGRDRKPGMKMAWFSKVGAEPIFEVTPHTQEHEGTQEIED